MQVLSCSQCGAKNRVDETRLAAGEAQCGRCKGKLVAVGTKPSIVTDATFGKEVLQVEGSPTLSTAGRRGVVHVGRLPRCWIN